jgi:hypothetical protein
MAVSVFYAGRLVLQEESAYPAFLLEWIAYNYAL